MAATYAFADTDVRQWRVLELTFVAQQTHTQPIDLEFSATFSGPGGIKIQVPGFWDGGNVWKIRFTPTEPGSWHYKTFAPVSSDAGLNDRKGIIQVLPADGNNPLSRHGGFLRVSKDNRYLTYTDGTPFFWLGDTWWFCPSKLCPFEGSSNPRFASMFKTLVDKRKNQGFSVVQMAFVGTKAIPLFKPEEWNEDAVRYWQSVDDYFRYANDAGLLPVIGIGFRKTLDRLSLEDLKQLWRYVVARYGAFAVTWLVVGEYNNPQNVQDRVQKVLRLGQYIKDIDPYRRAMSVHPSSFRHDKRQAWDQPWYDFIMTQGGHSKLPPISYYSGIYYRSNPKPLLESEARYEGIRKATADDVRLAAYRAIQAGSFGYTYGAHGLWYPTQNSNDRKFRGFGTPVPWWKALAKPGGSQMQHMRSCYESVNWWKLEPRPNAIFTLEHLTENQSVLVKADNDEVFVIYFPMGLEQGVKTALLGAAPDTLYGATWCNPRTGMKINLNGKNGEPRFFQRKLILPSPPDNKDWILIIRKQSN